MHARVVHVCDTGNGIELRMDDLTYRFDPRHVSEGDANFVSHAHSDHLPTRFGKNPVVCTALTRDLARTHRKVVEAETCDSAALLDAGHVPGSAMVFVDGSSKVLYTGDFCTRKKNHLSPAEPRRCDVLIMESTYGRPGYDFPEHEETISSIRDWLEDVAREDAGAVLLAYPIGKAQELCFELRDMPVLLQPAIARNNAVMVEHGLDICLDQRGDELPEPPFVYITSGMGRERQLVERLVSEGARAADFSGWGMGNRFAGRSNRGRETFPLSDHCGFNELLEFVRRCSPESVFTTHGSAEALARSIREGLGIQACALRRGQKSLDCYA
jgi:putative mRNA 3-end processing factor